jgi:hypothetical protein
MFHTYIYIYIYTQMQICIHMHMHSEVSLENDMLARHSLFFGHTTMIGRVKRVRAVPARHLYYVLIINI